MMTENRSGRRAGEFLRLRVKVDMTSINLRDMKPNGNAADRFYKLYCLILRYNVASLMFSSLAALRRLPDV